MKLRNCVGLYECVFWDYAFQFLNSVGPSERVSDAHVEPL